ncbi:NADPH-dependent FMN reductase [Micromonospora sp. NPDC049048]
MVTPGYNHSFPGSLKQAIDHAYDEWQAEPVGFVSYGCGSIGLTRSTSSGRSAPRRTPSRVHDGVGVDLLDG